MEQPRQYEREVSPQSFPETPPPQPADYNSFTLNTVMELQKTVGGLDQAIQSLTSTVESQGKILNRILYSIVFAAGGLFVFGFFGRLLFSKLDVLLSFIQSLPPSG